MTITEFNKLTAEIAHKGEPFLGTFTKSYYIDENNNCRFEDGGYNVYLTYKGEKYHVGFGVNGVEKIS